MFIKATIIVVSQLSFADLESAWWDCDTLYQQDKLINQEYIKCQKIDDEFRLYFTSVDDFNEYWNNYKLQQWGKRGYQPDLEIYQKI